MERLKYQSKGNGREDGKEIIIIWRSLIREKNRDQI